MPPSPSDTLRELGARIFQGLADAIQKPRLTLGGFEWSLASIADFAVVVCVGVVIARLVANRLVDPILRRAGVRPGRRFAFVACLRIVLTLLAVAVGTERLGCDATGLGVLLGVLGLGVGFGLQDVVRNLAAGIILLTSRPVEVGDLIETSGVLGRVRSIGLRTSLLVSTDNIAVLVPNGELVSKAVTNWTHGDPRVRIRLPVSVAYGSDPERVIDVLSECARIDPLTLPDPAPDVRLVRFGESSLDFEMLAWTKLDDEDPGRYRSRMNLHIHRALTASGIEIPFPQREIRVRSTTCDGHHPRIAPAAIARGSATSGISAAMQPAPRDDAPPPRRGGGTTRG